LKRGQHVHVVADVMVVAGRIRYTLEDFDCLGVVMEVDEASFRIQTITPVSHRHIIIEVFYSATRRLEIM
jgi:hypothetical protein